MSDPDGPDLPEVPDVAAAAPDPTAREWIEAELAPLLPKRWQLVWDEGSADDTGRTRLRLTQQSIERHPGTGTAATHLVTFAATLTVPADDFRKVEAQLDDDMELLLWAIDSIYLPWTKADKGLFGNRMGYQFTLQTTTYRKAAQ